MNDQRIITMITKRLEDYQPRILPMEMPLASVLIPLHLTENSLNIILTVRSKSLTTHRGQVAFPGGKCDKQDENLQATALRESQEEIDLSPLRVKILGQTDQVISRYGFKVTPFVGLIEGELTLKAEPAELDAIFHVPLNYFLDKNNMSIDELSYVGGTWAAPRYCFQGYDIWGLTAWMIADFLNATLDADIPVRMPAFR